MKKVFTFLIIILTLSLCSCVLMIGDTETRKETTTNYLSQAYGGEWTFISETQISTGQFTLYYKTSLVPNQNVIVQVTSERSGLMSYTSTYKSNLLPYYHNQKETELYEKILKSKFSEGGVFLCNENRFFDVFYAPEIGSSYYLDFETYESICLHKESFVPNTPQSDFDAYIVVCPEDDYTKERIASFFYEMGKKEFILKGKLCVLKPENKSLLPTMNTDYFKTSNFNEFSEVYSFDGTDGFVFYK